MPNKELSARTGTQSTPLANSASEYSNIFIDYSGRIQVSGDLHTSFYHNDTGIVCESLISPMTNILCRLPTQSIVPKVLSINS